MSNQSIKIVKKNDLKEINKSIELCNKLSDNQKNKLLKL